MAEQLTGMDASFLSLETDELPMHVLGVLLLDPAAGEGYSLERLRGIIADRLHLMPPFLRRLVDVPLGLDKPYWAYETEVDLDAHVFADRVPEPGDMRAVGRFVGAAASRRLDRSRPLWELHVAEGLADGRVVLVAKVHHATIYGAAGADFIAQLLDFGPQPRQVPPPGDEPAPPSPGGLSLLGRTALNQVRRPYAVARLALSGGRNAATTVRALGRIVLRHGSAALPFTAPRSAISGAATPARVAAFTCVPFAEAKRVKDLAGVKVNDVVVAVVALAVRRYLDKRGQLPGRPLVASCPLNAGEGASAGTNRIGAMLVPLPMDEPDPLRLLRAVHDATTASKEFASAAGTSTIADLAEVTPPAALSVATWLSRSLRLSALQPPMQNLIISNVMGPPIPLFLAGAKVDAIYPLGPLLPGAGLNITVLSNMDRLDVGLMACPDLVEDVWEIADAIPSCLHDLAAALDVA